ncbi:MAG TPA: hypothetical protein VGH19_11225 [Verrucomicrobiae bacterium]
MFVSYPLMSGQRAAFNTEGRRSFLLWGLVMLMGVVLPVVGEISSPLVFDWKKVASVYAGRIDQLRAVTTDTAGNTYLVGASASEVQGLNLITLKLGPAGQVLWQVEYDGEGGDDIPNAVVVSLDGDVYVTGSSINGAGNTDIVTLRYTEEGSPSPFWSDDGAGDGVRRYDGDVSGFDSGLQVLVDANGSAYVAAGSAGPGTFSDILLLKYSLNGVLFWEVRYDGPGHFTDTPKSLKFTASGNLLVLGESAGDGTEADWVLLQLDVNGNPASAWPDAGSGSGVRRYNHSGTSFDVPAAMQSDGSGAVYVAGTVTTSGAKDIVVAKFNPAGVLAWATSYNGEGTRNDEAVSLVLDTTGDVIVAGNTDRSVSGWDMVLLRLTETGNYSSVWADEGDGAGVRRHASDGSVTDMATGVGLGAGGYLYLGGYSFAAATADDAWALVYRRDGTFLGGISFDDETGASERPIRLLLASGDRLIMAGTSFGSSGEDDLFAVSFGIKPLLDLVADHAVVTTGKARVFSLPMANPSAYTYQWFRNGEILAGADEHMLTVSVQGAGQSGEYTVTVGNDFGLMEYVAGEITHLATSWTSVSGTELRLTGKSGARLLVDHADSVTGGIIWSPVNDITLGAGTSIVTDAGASGLPRRFYRVRRVANE